MNEQILFIGVDVDDKAFHGGAISQDGKSESDFKCKPTAGALVQRLKKYCEQGFMVKVCYEATFLGFSLYRQLRESGFECDVIAPSLVPRKAGEQVKTDRIDGKKLSRYYRSGDLTIVHVPTEAEETVRDVVRSRRFLKSQAKAGKLHILSLCRRLGLRYREAGKTASYWTRMHFAWLEKQAKEAGTEAFRFNLLGLIDTLKLLEMQREKYDVEIERIATEPFYKTKVQALCCYRGIDILTAMTFIVEFGDMNRFSHPKQTASYAGMDLKEDTSGGKEKKYRMTKMGNRHIRTAAIEASQGAFEPPRVSKRLKAQRENLEEKYIDIADRCMMRLHKKSTRLLYAGKAKNKIKVAAARELLCFVWESLRAAA
jgi:transposase